MTSVSCIDSTSGTEDFHKLKNHPLIQEYASMNDDLYNLVKATNPTLRMFVDLAREIMKGGKSK